MSTHRITDQTKIPFPCWLWYSKDRCWDWVDDSVGMAKHDTHYSTNPLDQRPGDVVPTIAEAASTPEAAEKLFEAFYSTATAPDPLAIAREAAAQIFITTATLPGKVEKAESIIHRAIEQATAALRAELEKVTKQRENARKAYRSVFEKMKETRKVCKDTVGQLTKNNAELRDQIQVLSTVKANEFEQTKQLLRDNETLRVELDAIAKELSERKWEGARAMEAVNQQIEVIQGQRAELEKAKKDRDAAVRETGPLRDAIFSVTGIPYRDGTPQSAKKGGVLPDDAVLIAALTALRAENHPK